MALSLVGTLFPHLSAAIRVWRLKAACSMPQANAAKATYCPIAKHAKAHGYEELLPYLCRTDHFLAEMMHARLIRTQTEALGGNCSIIGTLAIKAPRLKNTAV